MRQCIIQYDLYDRHCNLVKAGTGTEFENILDMSSRHMETFLCKPDRFKMEHIPQTDAERNDLSYDRSKCCAPHSHMQPKNKNRIQNCIYNSTHQHRCHRIPRTSIRKYQLTHPRICDQKWKANCRDSCIFLCIRKYLRCGTEEFQHRSQENRRYCKKCNPENCHQANSISRILCRFFFFSCTKLQ